VVCGVDAYKYGVLFEASGACLRRFGDRRLHCRCQFPFVNVENSSVRSIQHSVAIG